MINVALYQLDTLGSRRGLVHRTNRRQKRVEQLLHRYESQLYNNIIVIHDLPGPAMDQDFEIPKSSSTGTGDVFSAAINIRIFG